MMTVGDILKYLKNNHEIFEWTGDEELSIRGYCPLNQRKDYCVTWAKSSRYLNMVSKAERSKLLIVIGNDIGDDEDVGNYIQCENPKKVFFQILQHFFVEQTSPEIAPDAVILTKRIGKNVSIGHGCYIGAQVDIRDNVVIGNHVSIEAPAIIGQGSMIHSGVIIGADGFGYYKDGSEYGKVPHLGGVKIGQNVEIGANTCIDRGTMEDTVIEDGVKIDNLCHIAHNVCIGKNSLVIAMSMLGGSSVIGEHSYVAPGAMVMNQISVGDHSLIGMGSVVTKDVEPGKVVAGVPAKVLRDNQ